jgi:predicted DNA-binding protein YlxM (UPF0122 family)
MTKKKSKDELVKKGAPVKLTDENIVKLRELAELDASIAEMAYYCNVTKQTIFNWFERNPDLFDEIERLREKPILTIRRTVIEKANESYSNAVDYLKRKRKDEFGDSSTTKHEFPIPLLANVLSNNSNTSSDVDAKED